MNDYLLRSHLDNLILIGRPASGKSEIIDFLQHTTPLDRIQRFHVAELDCIDDFPMLWTWYEEDRLLTQRLGKPGMHTDERGYFLHDYQWDLLIERIGLDYQKKFRDHPNYHATKTALIEFSRGSQHGGYAEALPHLPREMLEQAGILYVRVSFEESVRKNRQRFNPEKPDSILEHSLPDDKLEYLYAADDWDGLTASDPHFLKINEVLVPYVVFENEDDVTTHGGESLALCLEQALGQLWLLKTEA